MKKNNIFSEDIKLPRTVSKKAEDAFLAIQTERSPIMAHLAEKEPNRKTKRTHSRLAGKTLAKRLAVAAACVALVLASGSLANPQKGMFRLPENGLAEPAQNETGHAGLTAAEQIDKMFTLQVKAAGMEEGKATPLEEGHPVPTITGSDKAGSWVLGSDTEGNAVDYCINIPQLTCEGEGIESITYSINRGAFQIAQPKDGQSILIGGQPYDGELNTGLIGGHYEDSPDAKQPGNPPESDGAADTEGGALENPYEWLLYQSFTVGYDKQSDENTWINFCNVCPDSREAVQLLWKEGGTEEDFFHGMQQILGQTTITCTVNYTDNTSQSVEINVGCSLMTRREAGEPLDPGMDPAELDKQTTVVTFELQP